jgi:acetylornithine deacetylase/succinyl-diaminopimelate desuccinylase-like protein
MAPLPSERMPSRALPLYADRVPERVDLERSAVELLQRLIRFRTVNPPGDEERAQHFLRDLLERAGFDCELLAAVPGRPNLVARLKGASDGPRLGLLGHIDTVLADPEDWSVDPWAGELRDGCVWGRGAIDMKCQVAAEIAAATNLARAGWRPEAGELLIVVTADEETGAAQGAQWLCAEHPEKVRCDLLVNEGAGPVMAVGDRRRYGVCVAEKGVFRFALRTHGRPGHASVPRIADNALVKLAPLLEALREGHPVRHRSPEGEALLRSLGLDAADPVAALAELGREDARLATLLEPTFGVTCTPTMASASRKINVIPGHAELAVDCRVPPGLGEAEARAAVHELLGDEGYELSFAETVTGNRSAIDTPLMDRIRAFVQREDPGSDVAPVVLAGFSDSHWWRAAFPECVAYGFFPQRAMDACEAYGLMHGVDERVPVDDVGWAAAFYAELMEQTLR